MSGTYALVALLVVLAGMAQVVWHNGAWRKYQEAAVTSSVSPSGSAVVQKDEKAEQNTEPAHQAVFSGDGGSQDGGAEDEKRKKPNLDKPNLEGSASFSNQPAQTEEVKKKRVYGNSHSTTAGSERQHDDRVGGGGATSLEVRAEELRKTLHIPERPVVETRAEKREKAKQERGEVRRAAGEVKEDKPEGTKTSEQEGSAPKETHQAKEQAEDRAGSMAQSEESGRQQDTHALREQHSLAGKTDGAAGEDVKIHAKNQQGETHNIQPPLEGHAARDEKVQQQREVVRAAAENARKLTERIREVEERTAKKLGVAPPPLQPLQRTIRKTLVEVARGEKTPEEAEHTLAQELVASGKIASEEEAQKLTRRLVEREIAQEVRSAAEEIARVRREVIRSPAEEVLADSDGDGLSDFEEKVLWGTDPRNSHTAGDILSDAERVLLGLDPLSTTTQPVPAASPREGGEVLPAVLEVSKVAAVPLSAQDEAQTQVATTTPPKSQAEEGSGERHATSTDNTKDAATQELPTATSTVGLALEGRAIPNTTAWLYIFSTPIVVAVRADETGVWRYTLRRELPDGEHEVYVAILNASGAVVAKSPPARFVKQAQAVTYIPPSPPQEVPTPERSLLDTLRASVVGVALAALGIIGLIAVMVVGLWRMRAERGEKPQ
ncbi:MAG: hypothetical protein KatS3mg099_113 [Candidatus Parcubacteria bacterium]|nr:MAG: hypothetical protein KatS3mg099_113 [Candidatus Parcubacteria bacterium]